MLTLTLPTAVSGQGLPDPLRHFATCTGRLSALTEHQWRTDGPVSEATVRPRDALADLLAAVTLPDGAVQAMALRIEAKAAHAALPAQAHRSGDKAAEMQAARLIAPCTGLLLG
ncbi:MAG: hypothetical protein ACK414_09560 [Gemmobacter sp.]